MRFRPIYYAFFLSSLVSVGCSKKEAPVVAKVEPTPTSNTTTTESAPSAPSSTYGESSPSSSSGYGGASGGYGGASGGYGGASSSPSSGYGGSNSSYGEGYGGSSSSYGSSYGQSGYGSSQEGSSSYGSGYGSSYGGSQEAKVAEPLTMMEAAEKAFEQGDERLAARFAKAAALSGAEDSSKILDATRWATAAQQPDLFTQIAVAIDVDAPEKLTEYNPIYYSSASDSNSGSSAYGSSYGGGSSYGSSYGGGTSNQAKKSTAKEVNYATDASKNFHTDVEKAAGLMATELLTFMTEQHAAGAWLPLFAEKEVEVKAPTQSSGGGGGYGGGYGSSYGSSYGSGYGGGYGGGEQKVVPNEDDPLQKKLGEKDENRIAAGLHYLGSGKTVEMIKKAKEEKYPVLIVFEVTVKPNLRINYTMNECRAKVINVATGKAIIMSKKLDNRAVAKSMADGKTEVVKDAMAVVFEKLKLAALTDLPEGLTAEVIKSKRWPTLVDDASRDKLDSLYELLLYKQKGLLTDADYQTGCEKILGESGTQLATGSAEEKAAVLVDLI